MESEAQAMLSRSGVPKERWEVTRTADCRYPRQAYELTVPLGGGVIDRAVLDRLAQAFHERHRATYGHASPDEPVQLVNLRVSALGRQAPLDLARAQANKAAGPPATRPVYFKETKLAPCEVVDRDGLAPGASRSGPLIVEAPDTTIVVPPGWRLSVDAGGLIVLERTHA